MVEILVSKFFDWIGKQRVCTLNIGLVIRPNIIVEMDGHTLWSLFLLALAVMYFLHRNLFGLPARRVTRTDVVRILTFGALFGSTFSNDWQFAGYQPAATLLFFYAMPLALYWIASRCPISEQAHGWIFGFFAAFGCYLALTGICEVLEITPAVFPRYISNPEFFEFLGRRLRFRASNH